MIAEDTINPENYFKNPQEPAQRRYEALRAYYLESLTQEEAAKRAGYSKTTFQSLVSNFQNGKIQFFMTPEYGPKRRRVSDYEHKKIIALRKTNHSIYEIKDVLSSEGHKTSIQTINRILNDEGFSKLQRRTGDELGLSKKRTLIPYIPNHPGNILRRTL